MGMFTNILLVIGAIAILVATGAIIVLVGLKRRRENTSSPKSADKTGAKGGITEKVKKTLAERPSWLVTLAAVGGGWLFLLFSAYVLLPDTWRWLAAHPELLWMTPLAIFAAQTLRASKKKAAEYLAYAIILVLLVAFVKAIPWGSGGESADTRRAAEQETVISVPAQWSGCIPLPQREPPSATAVVTERISAPVGTESPCYLVRYNYWFRMTPITKGTTVRFRFQDRRIMYLREAKAATEHIPLLNSVQNVGFVMQTLDGEKPGEIIFRLTRTAPPSGNMTVSQRR